MTKVTGDVYLSVKEAEAGRAPAGAPDASAREAGADPLLDTRLRNLDKLQGKLFRNRSAGRLWSRSKLGMMVPGDFYWITWTSSPQSPMIKKSWNALQRFLHRYRPEMAWIYCFTNEGYGVIHMIVRLPKGSPRLEIKDLREHWERLHRAIAVIIKEVHNPKGLSDYLADQEQKRGMAREMHYQPLIERWRMSQGWLPIGFAKAFGRFWQSLGDTQETVRDQVLREWLLDVLEDYENIYKVPSKDSEGNLRR
jgi:hypothetical protein